MHLIIKKIIWTSQWLLVLQMAMKEMLMEGLINGLEPCELLF